jgi:hypothetical protein
MNCLCSAAAGLSCPTVKPLVPVIPEVRNDPTWKQSEVRGEVDGSSMDHDRVRPPAKSASDEKSSSRTKTQARKPRSKPAIMKQGVKGTYEYDSDFYVDNNNNYAGQAPAKSSGGQWNEDDNSERSSGSGNEQVPTLKRRYIPDDVPRMLADEPLSLNEISHRKALVTSINKPLQKQGLRLPASSWNYFFGVRNDQLLGYCQRRFFV